MPDRYPLPGDTAAALVANASRNKNLGLALDRFCHINGLTQDNGDPWPKPEDVWKITDQAKRRGEAPLSLNDPVPTIIKHSNARRRAMLSGLRAQGQTVCQITAKPDYRLIVGFGAAHVLETGICLHRIFGFPLIPGSAVKGITRYWAFWEIAEHLGVPAIESAERERRKRDAEADNRPESKSPLQRLDDLLSTGEDAIVPADQNPQQAALKTLKADPLCAGVPALQSLNLSQWNALAADFYAVFGTTQRQGQVTFFDAFPTGKPTLEVDILNPHFSKYYGGTIQPPADNDNPIPSYFLTVGKESEFKFALSGKNKALTEWAEQRLKDALAEAGIGSKTSAGYGFMKIT